MPALLIRMSIRPNSTRARSAIALRSARDVTSVLTTLTRRPRPLTSDAVRSAPAWSSSATTMSAPIPASSSAVARPMPRPAPVTIATCPDSSMSDLLYIYDGVGARAGAPCRRPGALPSDFDRLDHARGVQRREIILPKPEDVGQHAVGVLAE